MFMRTFDVMFDLDSVVCCALDAFGQIATAEFAHDL